LAFPATAEGGSDTAHGEPGPPIYSRRISWPRLAVHQGVYGSGPPAAGGLPSARGLCLQHPGRDALSRFSPAVVMQGEIHGGCSLVVVEHSAHPGLHTARDMAEVPYHPSPSPHGIRQPFNIVNMPRHHLPVVTRTRVARDQVIRFTGDMILAPGSEPGPSPAGLGPEPHRLYPDRLFGA
jgi:hypothetical protein